MNTRKEISKALAKVHGINKKRTESYKNGIKNTITENLKKGQTVEENQVLVDRYYSAKTKELSQMQEAMQGAVA